MSYKLEEGHKAIAEGFSELVNNRNNFQDAITLDVEEVKTTVHDIKQTVNATCRLADQTVAVLLSDDHINQEGKVVDSENVVGLEDLNKELNKEIINLFANASKETKTATNEVKEIIEDQTETIKTRIYEHGWDSDSIGDLNGSINDIDNNVDELISTVSGIEDCVNNMGDLDLGSIEIVSDKLDDLSATLDRTDLEELNSDINTLTKVCTDNRADLARIHESMNSQFNNISERRVTQFQNVNGRLIEMDNSMNLQFGTTNDKVDASFNYISETLDTQFKNVSERLTKMGIAMDTQFNNINEVLKTYIDPVKDFVGRMDLQFNQTQLNFQDMNKTIDAQVKDNLSLGKVFEDYLSSHLPKYFEAHQASTKHIVDELFIKHSEKLSNQTHSQIEDQEGSLYAMENKLDNLDVNVKQLIDNIAFLDDHSKKCTDKVLGEKIHNAISYGFTNLNTHVEDMVKAVIRIKEESILTNYDVHTNNSQTESSEEN